MLIWVTLLASLLRVRAFALLRETGLLQYFSSDDLVYWNWSGELARTRDWIGSEPFFLGPLYPYVLALARSASASAETVLVAQCVLTVLSILLLTVTVLRVSGIGAAVVLGTLLALAPPLLLHDLSLVSESMLFALGCALAVLATEERVRRRPDSLGVLLGCLVGLMSLARPAYFLLLVPVGVLLHQISDRRTLRPGALALATACLIVLPPTLRHIALGYGPIGVTYSAGYNLFVGNGPGATGTFMPVGASVDWEPPSGRRSEGGTTGDGRREIALRTGSLLTPMASSNEYVAMTMTWWTDQPMTALRLQLRKAWLIFQGDELSQVTSMSSFEAAAGPLAAPARWAWMLLVASLGVALVCASRGAEPVAVRFQCGVLIVHVVIMMSAFVIDRYKVHMIPAVVLLAATSLARDGLTSATAVRRASALLLFSLLVSATIASARVANPDQAAFSALATIGDSQLESRRWAEAAESYQLAHDRLKLVPAELRASAAGQLAIAGASLGWAKALQMLGRHGDAAVKAGEAAELMPRSAEARAVEIAALTLAGDVPGAESRLLEIHPSMRVQVKARLQAEVIGLEGRGEGAQVTALLGLLADSWARSEEVVVALARALLLAGEWTESENQIELARAQGLAAAVCDAHRFAIALGRGDDQEAARWRAMLPVSAGADPRVQAALELGAWVRSARDSHPERK